MTMLRFLSMLAGNHRRSRNSIGHRYLGTSRSLDSNKIKTVLRIRKSRSTEVVDRRPPRGSLRLGYVFRIRRSSRMMEPVDDDASGAVAVRERACGRRTKKSGVDGLKPRQR